MFDLDNTSMLPLPLVVFRATHFMSLREVACNAVAISRKGHLVKAMVRCFCLSAKAMCANAAMCVFDTL